MADVPEQIIEVDPSIAGDSEFSDYESGFGSDTTSLATAAKNHVFENGRRFHGWREGQYAMPNDEQEQDRMDLQHHICLLTLKGKLYAAPALKNPQRILDLGAGTGIWAIDMGDSYPEAEVTGIDLSPIQPQWVPPNVSFVLDDIEEPWPYKDNHFDFIYMRQLTGFISDWPKLYAQAFRVLKPGGWFETNDFVGFACDDDSLPKDSATYKWFNSWVEATATIGREVPSTHKDGLISVGFESVVYHPFKIPVGPWAKEKSEKELGLYMRQHYLDGAESISLAVLTRFLKWEKKEVDEFLDKFRKEVMNRAYHTYAQMHCSYGRKPGTEDA